MVLEENYQESFEEQRAAILRKLYETHKEKIEIKKKVKAAEFQQRVLKTAAAGGAVVAKKVESKENFTTSMHSASGQVAIKKELKILLGIRLPTTKRTFLHILSMYAVYKKIECDTIPEIFGQIKLGNIDLIVLEENNDPDFDTKIIIELIRKNELEKDLINIPILILKKEDKGIYDKFILKDKSLISINILQDKFQEEFKKKIVPIFTKKKEFYFIAPFIQVEWEDEIVTLYFNNDINIDDAVKLKSFLDNEKNIKRFKECFSININLYYCSKAPAMAISLLVDLHKKYDTVVFYLIMKDTPVNEALSQFDDLNINIL